MSAPTGVLLMAYGSPASVDGIEAYYTHIRRGTPPTAEQLADLRRRYDAIGGVSPLAARTEAQRAGVAKALGAGWVVELGAKHAPPFIEDGVRALAAAGCERAIGVVLAPHYSRMSVGEYAARAAEGPIPLTTVPSWHMHPELIALLAERWRDASAEVRREGLHTLFTAHSLPQRIVAEGDPYPDQLAETAAAVASAAGIPPNAWSVAWQSAGRTPEPWLGPDVRDAIRERAASGATAICVVPCGFTSDHLEVLYDIDVDAVKAAGSVGVRLVRTAMPNDDPRFCALVADVVRAAASDDHEDDRA